MKKSLLFLIFLVVSVVDFAFANNNVENYCKLSKEKMTVVKKDTFGNTKKIKTDKFNVFITELLKNPSKSKNKKTIMKIWGEIFALNKEYYEDIFSDEKERYIEFYVYTNTLIPIAVKQGRLPYQLNLNLLNILNKKMKITASVSISSLGGSLMNYIFPYKNFDLGKDRMLSLLALFVTENYSFLPKDCGGDEVDKLSLQFLETLSYMIMNKNVIATKVAYYLAKNDFQKVDEFLLSNKKISQLFRIAKQHYLEILKERKNAK